MFIQSLLFITVSALAALGLLLLASRTWRLERRLAVVRSETAAAERQAVLDAEVARKLEERRLRRLERDAVDRARAVRNLIRAYRLRFRPGPVPFFHWTPDRGHVHRMWVPESVAWDLRKGALGVAWSGDDPEEPAYVVVSGEAARRIQGHDPSRILFLNDGPPPKDDPAEKPFGLE